MRDIEKALTRAMKTDLDELQMPDRLPHITRRARRERILFAAGGATLLVVAVMGILWGVDALRSPDREGTVNPSSAQSLIAFTIQTFPDDQTPVVAIMSSRGGNVTRLHKGSDPSWSPAGHQLVFSCHPGICTMDPDGSNVKRLTQPEEGIEDGSPSWGSGGYIAFTRIYKNERRNILVIPEEGGRAAPLTDEGTNFDPSWSPDGGSIAFIRGPSGSPEAIGSYQLWTMRSDGSDLHQLTDTPDEAARPDWSPDGSLIVFDLASALWTISPEGHDLKKLEPATTGEGIEGLGSFATWSASGRRIAYVCSEGFDDNDLCVMNSDGTGRTLILDTPANEAAPSWQRPRP